VGYLFPLFGFAVGLLLWWLAIKGVLVARRQRDWPETQGVIRTSSVKVHDAPLIGKVHSTGWSGSGGPQVTYEYTVDGRTFTGSKVGVPPGRTRVRFGTRRRHGDMMDWNLSLYEQGRTVPVYYNPDDPADAVLHKAESGGCGVVMLFFVGSVFILIGWIAWGVVSALS
jgi:hypothetical protein